MVIEHRIFVTLFVAPVFKSGMEVVQVAHKLREEVERHNISGLHVLYNMMSYTFHN